jgi:hypothetical protein
VLDKIKQSELLETISNKEREKQDRRGRRINRMTKGKKG